MAQFYADRVALGSHRAKSPEGYLICLGIPFARTGFQTYKAGELGLRGDRLVKVYRRFDQVFSPATLSSFEGKSITNPHPPGFLNPDNDKEYSMGHVQNVRQGPTLPDGEHAMLGDLVIKDSRLINRIESGELSELSAGYECEYENDDHAPDIYYQMNIRGNHVAVVPTGRAGSAVKILDSDTVKEESIVAETVTQPEERVSVSTLKSLTDWLQSLGSRKTVDSESEAVTRNEELNNKAKERAVKRNEDADREEEEMESEEKEAKKPKDRKTKDEDKEEKEERKKMTDAFNRMADAFEKMSEKKEEKKEKAEDEDEEEKKEKKKESEDSELIPVATLGEGERPKNPIPGADADTTRALNGLMAIKSLVADSGDPTSIVAWNDAYLALKGRKRSNDGYSDLAKGSKKDVKRATELSEVVQHQDANEVAEDFVNTTRYYLGKNVKEGAAAAAEARKEKK